MSLDTQNLKVGPCSITYKGELLGITSGSSVLTFKFSNHDVKVNRTHEQVIDKRLTGIHIYFKTEIFQIDKGVNHLLNENKTWTLDDLGRRQTLHGGELLIVPISPNDKTAYRLPNALVVNQGELTFSNTDEYILQLEFESNYNDGEEILIECLDADTCQRETLQRTSIAPASLERAMTAYIADKLNMTVDTNIFRGILPPNIDGCGVQLLRVETESPALPRKHYFSFFSINAVRDIVIENVKSLADNFPAYGENLIVEGTDGVTCQLMEMLACEFSKETMDNGKVKYCGELFFKILI